MKKLASMIIESSRGYLRNQRTNIGEPKSTILGSKIYSNVKKNPTEAELNAAKKKSEKRIATIKANQEAHDKFIQTQAEANAYKEEINRKAAELRERNQKEIQIEQIRQDTEKQLRADEVKRLNDEKLEQNMRDAQVEDAKKAKDAIEHNKAIISNSDRQQKYEKDINAVKEHEKPKPIDKPKPTTSGLISTEVRSLRF
jgi:hypothetical protein